MLNINGFTWPLMISYHMLYVEMFSQYSRPYIWSPLFSNCYWSWVKAMDIRTDTRLAPSRWETLLRSNVISHWLGINLESALDMFYHACVDLDVLHSNASRQILLILSPWDQGITLGRQKNTCVLHVVNIITADVLGPLLWTWINLNSSTDK